MSPTNMTWREGMGLTLHSVHDKILSDGPVTQWVGGGCGIHYISKSLSTFLIDIKCHQIQYSTADVVSALSGSRMSKELFSVKQQILQLVAD